MTHVDQASATPRPRRKLVLELICEMAADWAMYYNETRSDTAQANAIGLLVLDVIAALHDRAHFGDRHCYNHSRNELDEAINRAQSEDLFLAALHNCARELDEMLSGLEKQFIDSHTERTFQ